MSVGSWIDGAASCSARRSGVTASNDSCPRLGWKLRGEPHQLSRTVAPAGAGARAAYSEMRRSIKSFVPDGGRTKENRPGHRARAGHSRPMLA